MVQQPVRIAQVGLTNHGLTILNAIRDARSLRLVALFDIRAEETSRLAREYQARPAASYDEILADREIDAVALVTPNHLHADQIEAAFRAGKHVFVEKPITRTTAEAKHSIEQARKAGRLLMVGHNTRRRPMFRRVKQVLDQQTIGIVAGVAMNMSRPVGIQSGLPAWKTDPKAANLVPMTQLGIHFADTVRYLLGPVARVGCVAHHAAMPGGAWDSAHAILQLESGIPVSLSAAYVTPDEYSVRIWGTRGVITCSVSGFEVHVMDNGKLRAEFSESFPNEGFASYREEMEEFGECVLQGKQPETGGNEGLAALAVIEAMLRSLDTRRIIELREVLES